MSYYQIYLACGVAGDMDDDDDDVDAEDEDRADSDNWVGERKGGLEEEDEKENEDRRMCWIIKGNYHDGAR